jgi:hypothetical protein
MNTSVAALFTRFRAGQNNGRPHRVVRARSINPFPRRTRTVSGHTARTKQRAATEGRPIHPIPRRTKQRAATEGRPYELHPKPRVLESTRPPFLN